MDKVKRKRKYRRVFRRRTKLIIGSRRDFSDIPVIFLDIDGVLNSAQQAHQVNRKKRGEWDPYRDECCHIAISNLMEIMENVPKCHIVISSTWRKATSITHLRYIFKMWGFQYPNRIVAKTPCLDVVGGKRVIRGKEIKWFCDKYKVKNYIIIDDDSDMMKSQMDRFVQTDNYHGLMFRDALKGIEILKGEKPPVTSI